MKKILIIQNKRIGDVLLSSVIANNIKSVFPDSRVDFFAYDYASAVLVNNPNIDRLITVSDAELKKPKILLQHIRAIKANKYDIIFDPYAKLQSKLMCLHSAAPYRIGFKRANKKLKLPFYTHVVDFLEKSSKICGKAIEDRINIVDSVFPLSEPKYEPKLFLTDKEEAYKVIGKGQYPLLMLGVLGSTPQKSMPYPYVAEVIDHITANYKVTILFNYAPHQKAEALKIYDLCDNQEQINLDIYENSVRGFIKLMNKCDLLISNEGGSVHMAKALDKPTFTIYSPYILKDHWASFEDGIKHQSIHLLEEKPDAFPTDRAERKRIEKNPTALYEALTPKMIIKKLEPFLKHHLKA